MLFLTKESREELEELRDGLYQELMTYGRLISDMDLRQEKLRKELFCVEDKLGLIPGLGASVNDVKLMEGMAMSGVHPDTMREFYSENDVTESYKSSDTESSVQSNIPTEGINHVNDDGNWNNASGYGLHRRMGLYLADMYQKKNSDYGDAFGKSLDKHGMKAAIVRMEDKLGRLDALTSGTDQQVFDEKLEDTVLDLANYAIMTAMYMIEKGR